jgi:NAD(P)-dependent dehydrogenase (short-subunit alcohol dehydrogenase family)
MPVASITGAGRGIGRACAIALARAGFDLVLNDLTAEALGDTSEAVQATGRLVHLVVGDIKEEGARIGATMAAALGPITTHVNNAGVPMRVRGDLLEVAPEDFDHVLGVNTRGTFMVTQSVARRMVEDDPSAGPQRSIITITSVSAALLSPERGPYCMSKAASSAMVRLFALRLAAHGIACHEVRPGIIRTPMTAPVAERYEALIAGGLSPIPRWGEADDVARTVVLLAQGAVPFSTGDIFHVDGGLHLQRL